MLLWGEGQEICDGAELVDLGLQLGVCGEVALELPALPLIEGAEYVGALEVVEVLAPGFTFGILSRSFVAYLGTSLPLVSKYSRIFCSPSLIRPLTVPSGRSSRFAISVWVYPE